MKKALVIGIDYYERVGRLHGCVNDAYAVKNVLERHGDGSPNFGVNAIVASDAASKIERRQFKDMIIELFKDDADIALFYFSGHGYIESTGGYLITSECTDGDDGFSMDELLTIANSSQAKNKVVILDCCHSGMAGSPANTQDKAFLSEGVTILTASARDQYSLESGGSGVFTTLFVDALNGSAANLVGDITPGSVYAHIDQSLGPWEQRPIFKTNVKRFISLREVQPPIALEELRQIDKLFPDPTYNFPLDPSFEPTADVPNEQNTETFSLLQKYNRINLVKPIDEEHMYYAAMNSTGCKLTVLGAHY
ncbi:caspase family protein [Nitrosococcus wardiae]|uniref:Caspase family protein n=1 Tax=Nitrosococcus wardiae TaxID=1814290 RepID=A0A4P7C337_9GAMM|nr:caspase family protein [Nitrosococcus wardiae]QBQ56189.1 caspase family protein [Nitrosococcus wardiae]